MNFKKIVDFPHLQSSGLLTKNHGKPLQMTVFSSPLKVILEKIDRY
jgi:hypothetical protein